MTKSKKRKTCIYPQVKDCGETARFVTQESTLASVREEGLEGYDLVYIADPVHKKVFLFGTSKGAFCTQPLLDTAQPVHARAHQKAAQGEVVSYEWSMCDSGNNCFFQSTLIPLRDGQGKVGSLLGLVKNITHWANTYSHAQFLREVGRRSFPQVLLMAREEERRQLTAALHDEIGSAAVILTSLLSMVKDSVEEKDSVQALKDISALDKQIKNSIERIKNIVVSVRPPNLETVGLEPALRDLVENAAHYGHLEHSFEVTAEDELPVSDEVKIVLYRVVQEGLNNILKHAKATRVEVRLHRGTNETCLSVCDNGKGFKQVPQQSIEHMGLLSMQDSVAYLGGTFKIKSEPGQGTCLEVRCPKVVYGEKKDEYKSSVS